MWKVIPNRHKGLVKLGTGVGLISSGILLIFLNYTNSSSVDFLLPLILSVFLIGSGITTMAHAGFVDTRAQYESDLALINSPDYLKSLNPEIDTATGNWKEQHIQSRERRRKNNEILTVSFVLGIFLVTFPIMLLARNVPIPQVVSDLEGYAIYAGVPTAIFYALTHVFWRGGRRSGYTNDLRMQQRS